MERKYYIRRIPLDKGGYERGGQYWGEGAPLYRCEHKVTGETVEFRASDRFQAKVKLNTLLKGKGLAD